MHTAQMLLGKLHIDVNLRHKGVIKLCVPLAY